MYHNCCIVVAQKYMVKILKIKRKKKKIGIMVEVKNDLLLSVLERDADLNRLKKKKKTVLLFFQHDKCKQYKFNTIKVLYTYAYTIREEREVNLLTVKPETCRTQP